MPNRVVFTIFGRDKFSGMAKKIKASTKAVTTQFTRMHKAVKKVSSGLKKAGQAMTKFSAAAALAVAGSLKAFGDMEQGVTNVLTLLSDDEIEKFGGKLNKLATESLTKFGFSTEEATQALFNNVSALGTNTKSLAVFSEAQRLAIGGVTSLDTAVAGMAGIMNAYKLSASDATKVSNAFFAAQKKGTTDVTLLASNVGQVAPIAKTMGVGFQELLATMAQLTQGAISTEEATTALKGALTLLKKPSTEGIAVFKKYGIPFGVTAVKQAGLNKTLTALSKAMRENEDELASAIPNIRAFTAIATLQGDELSRIRDIMASMNQDQLSPAFAMQMETFNRASSILKGTLTVVAIQIGAELAPAFLFIASIIKKAANVFGSFSGTTKKFIAISIGVVAVMTPLLIALSTIVAFGGPVIAVMGGFVAALFGWPVAIGIATAAVVSFLSHAVWKNFDKIKDAFSTVKNFLGFGEEGGNLDVSGAASITSKSTTDINVGITTPAGTTAEVKHETTGNKTGPNVGVAMQEAF